MPLNIDFRNVPTVLQLLQTQKADYSNIEWVIAHRLAELLGCGVRLTFSCPTSENNSIESRLGICVSTTEDGRAELNTLDKAASASGTRYHRVFFSERSDIQAFSPLVDVEVDIDLPQDWKFAAEAFLRDFLYRIVYRQNALLRNAIVAARLDSPDLNSFLHKVLRREKSATELLGVEGCSVFVIDAYAPILRLRGTTGLKTPRSIKDIYFHDGETTNIWRVFNASRLYIDYCNGEKLREGKSAEATRDGATYKLYLPIDLRESYIHNGLIREPAKPVGVVRFTNQFSEGLKSLPMSWPRIANLKFMTEALFNICHAYLEADRRNFQKDEAFHSSTSIIDSVCKNVDTVRRSLFHYPVANDLAIEPRFNIEPIQGKRAGKPDQLKRFLDTAYACALDLSYQIERANDIAQFEARSRTERLMTEVILRAWEELTNLRITHSVHETIRAPSGGELFELAGKPPPVQGPPDALFSVFLNVIENAIKYRRPKETLKLDVTFETTNDFVIVRLSDNGVGIEEGEEERIFDRMYRTDRAREYVKRGSGLGLAWARGVIEACGGKITAERLPKGLCLCIMFRRA